MLRIIKAIASFSGDEATHLLPFGPQSLDDLGSPADALSEFFALIGRNGGDDGSGIDLKVRHRP